MKRDIFKLIENELLRVVPLHVKTKKPHSHEASYIFILFAVIDAMLLQQS